MIALTVPRNEYETVKNPWPLSPIPDEITSPLMMLIACVSVLASRMSIPDTKDLFSSKVLVEFWKRVLMTSAIELPCKSKPKADARSVPGFILCITTPYHMINIGGEKEWRRKQNESSGHNGIDKNRSLCHIRVGHWPDVDGHEDCAGQDDAE